MVKIGGGGAKIRLRVVPHTQTTQTMTSSSCLSTNVNARTATTTATALNNNRNNSIVEVGSRGDTETSINTTTKIQPRKRRKLKKNYLDGMFQFLETSSHRIKRYSTGIIGRTPAAPLVAIESFIDLLPKFSRKMSKQEKITLAKIEWKKLLIADKECRDKVRGENKIKVLRHR